MDIYALSFVPQVYEQFLGQILTGTFIRNESVYIRQQQGIMPVKDLPQGILVAKSQSRKQLLFRVVHTEWQVRMPLDLLKT